MKLEIKKTGIFVDGHEIKNVISADVADLRPDRPAEVTLRIRTDEVEIDHKWLGHGTDWERNDSTSVKLFLKRFSR